MTSRHVMMAISVMTIWGFNFLAIKNILDVLPPFLALTLRFATVCVILLPFVGLPRGRFGQVMIVSLLLGVGHFGLYFFGMARVDGGLGAVLVQTEIIFIAILGVILLREEVNRSLIAAFLIALVGMAFLLFEPSERVVQNSSARIIGAASILVASFSWALSNYYIKRRFADVGTFTLLAWTALGTTPLMLLLSLLVEGIDPWMGMFEVSSGVWGALAYIIIGSNLIAYYLWYELVKECPLSRISLFLLFVPVVAIAANVIFRGESLTTARVIGALCVFSAIALSKHSMLPRTNSVREANS
ncbi:MAG: EamA family transporter [Bdellovibrionales bacterium]|nr:EamA family transporter [Bdellovibrionales bacterium]